jgi:FtsH-binding integral membrane protein
MLLFYSQICLLMGLIHMKAEKRRTYLMITASVVLLIGNLINSFFSANFILHLRISIGFLLASVLLLLIGLQSVRLENYTERFIGYHQIYRNRTKTGGQTS